MRIGMIAAVIAAFLAIDSPDARAQDPFGDSPVITEFQRSVDTYAFMHRQVERRHGTPAPNTEGAIFTAPTANAFRQRLQRAIRSNGCEPPPPGVNFTVPRVNASASGFQALSACLGATLPKLPAELEYRTAGVALLLVDAHTAVVVDVLHAAFPEED